MVKEQYLISSFKESKLTNMEDHPREVIINQYDEDKEIKHVGNNYFAQTVISIMCHPLEYSKVLIQLGHEPIAPRLGRNIFGRQVLVLPNSIQYIKYIRRTDGFVGCYTGLLPTILGNIVSSSFTLKVISALKLDWPEDIKPKDIFSEDEPKLEEYIKYGRKEITICTVSIIISYPFRVVTVRMMASFVGKEENYHSMFSAIASIYRDNGFSGFFSGLIPRLIGEITCIASSVLLAYFVNKYFIKTREFRGYTLPVLTYLSSTVTYPLTLVSTCMAVCGSSLAAGNPPRMPLYSSWRACFSDLLMRNQHKRGGSLFFRYYTGQGVNIQSYNKK